MPRNMRPAETLNQPFGNKGVVVLPEAVRTSDRCRATHDVPYTLRCVLKADHVHEVLRSATVQSGEHAGKTVVVYEPHEDKQGNRW